MRLLQTFGVSHPSETKYIKLYQGDLAAIPPAEAVDLLVISAFPNDYEPTSTSLIGALSTHGVSVDDLSRDKAVDLRESLSCWLSQDLSSQYPNVSFTRILCFEPTSPGTAPEVVGNVFRAIMPFALGDPPIRSIAMPVLASGDQRVDSEVMLGALFDASFHWLERGMPVQTIKIVAFAEHAAQRLERTFAALSSKYSGAGAAREHHLSAPPAYDFFVSYAHGDGSETDGLVQDLKAANPRLRVFQDRLELKPGEAWQTGIDQAIAGCRRVIAVYSPLYLASAVCMEEFNMARVRHRSGNVLLPVYLRTADLILYMETLEYIDCREGDPAKIRAACDQIVALT